MKGNILRIPQLLSKGYGCFKNEVKENMGLPPASASFRTTEAGEPLQARE